MIHHNLTSDPPEIYTNDIQMDGKIPRSPESAFLKNLMNNVNTTFYGNWTCCSPDIFKRLSVTLMDAQTDRQTLPLHPQNQIF